MKIRSTSKQCCYTLSELMKIMHIIGNRPQFIKLAIQHKAFKSYSHVDQLILHTGQHFDYNMSDIFFDEFDIPKPNFTLNINNLDHVTMIGQMILEIGGILASEKPNWIIVYGDTNTTLAGALAAKKMQIKIAHIESGVRTFNETMPEESNRYLTDRMSDLNLCCTYLNLKNLQKESYVNGNIQSKCINTGDLMFDAFTLHKKKLNGTAHTNTADSYVLATIHRAENINNLSNLAAILDSLNKINQIIKVVLPVHPKTKRLIADHCIPVSFSIIDVVGYNEMQSLLHNSGFVITDSGGFSREAFFAQKPTVIIMDKPFWPEIFEHGNCLRANAVADDIITKFNKVRTTNKSFNTSVFGDGNAAGRICEAILKF